VNCVGAGIGDHEVARNIWAAGELRRRREKLVPVY
jgi:hypothetical protein